VLDPGNAQVNAYAATTYTLCGDSGRAVSHAEHAVALNPNDAKSLNALGQALTYAGDQQRPGVVCPVGEARSLRAG